MFFINEHSGPRVDLPTEIGALHHRKLAPPLEHVPQRGATGQALTPMLSLEGWDRLGPYPQAIIRGVGPARP